MSNCRNFISLVPYEKGEIRSGLISARQMLCTQRVGVRILKCISPLFR